MALTAKQQRFVEEYCVDWNATQAAIRAGYNLMPWRESDQYYVYALIDPMSEEIFYIGKGKGKRCFQHEKNYNACRVENPRVFDRIASVRLYGERIKIVLFEIDLTEELAYHVEKNFIIAIGKDNLANLKRGQQTDLQRAIAKAKHLFGKIIPFDVWLASHPRTAEDIETYNLITKVLSEYAGAETVPI